MNLLHIKFQNELLKTRKVSLFTGNLKINCFRNNSGCTLSHFILCPHRNIEVTNHDDITLSRVLPKVKIAVCKKPTG